MTQPDVLLAGLPATGKTTYLALAYTAIVLDPEGELQLGSFKGDREYLNRISDALAECKVAEHTEVDEQGELELPLLIGANERFIRIPDVSGETWEEALDTRTWREPFDVRVSTCGGLMLFIHGTLVETGVTILDADAAEAALLEGVKATDDSTRGDTSTEAATNEDEPGVRSEKPPFGGDAADANDIEPSVHKRSRVRATQVDSVDLLQIVAQRNRTRALRLSVVISAWEGVEGVTPEKWVEQTLPLLSQYLQNSRIWETRVWGVSGQGGDFTDENVKEELLKKSVVERAIIEAGDGSQATVHSPLLWVLGVE